MTDIVIIGGGMAGMTAAIYAKRAGKSVAVIEHEGFGGQITIAPRVENFPGFSEIGGVELAAKLVEQAEALGVEIEFSDVLKVEKRGREFTVVTDGGETLVKSVILAVGAKHRPLGIAREEELAGSGVSYCAVCDGAFFAGQSVAVIGGGNAAFQYAEFLAGMCEKVYIVHRRKEFRADESLVSRVKRRQNVELITDSTVDALLGAEELSGVRIKNVASGEVFTLPIAGLFVAVGQSPNTQPFSALVETDAEGYIVAGEDCRTSVPGIFAAGDCRVKRVRQLVTAAADGAVAAMAAAEYADSLEK